MDCNFNLQFKTKKLWGNKYRQYLGSRVKQLFLRFDTEFIVHKVNNL